MQRRQPPGSDARTRVYWVSWHGGVEVSWGQGPVRVMVRPCEGPLCAIVSLSLGAVRADPQRRGLSTRRPEAHFDAVEAD